MSHALSLELHLSLDPGRIILHRESRSPGAEPGDKEAPDREDTQSLIAPNICRAYGFLQGHSRPCGELRACHLTARAQTPPRLH